MKKLVRCVAFVDGKWVEDPVFPLEVLTSSKEAPKGRLVWTHVPLDEARRLADDVRDGKPGAYERLIDAYRPHYESPPGSEEERAFEEFRRRNDDRTQGQDDASRREDGGDGVAGA